MVDVRGVLLVLLLAAALELPPPAAIAGDGEPPALSASFRPPRALARGRSAHRRAATAPRPLGAQRGGRRDPGAPRPALARRARRRRGPATDGRGRPAARAAAGEDP
jgi:hypothetical protein